MLNNNLMYKQNIDLDVIIPDNITSINKVFKLLSSININIVGINYDRTSINIDYLYAKLYLKLEVSNTNINKLIDILIENNYKFYLRG